MSICSPRDYASGLKVNGIVSLEHMTRHKEMLNSKPYRGLLGLGAEEGHGKL